jgi:drug/metabolite transporter (DMT)-like permease
MGIGTGIVLIVLGLILLLGAVDLPSSVDDVIASETLGWILLLAGALGLVLALVLNKQRSRTTHVEEHREV